MSVVRTVAPAILVSGFALASVAFSAHSSAAERAATSVDQARVVAVNPVYRRVDYSVPTEQCRLVDVPMALESRHTGYRSYTGPILGAILGGAIGNAVGHGKTNKKVGTAVGAVLGGTIGRDIQRRHTAARHRSVVYQTEEVC